MGYHKGSFLKGWPLILSPLTLDLKQAQLELWEVRNLPTLIFKVIPY